jgi:hypothetical protein
VLSAAVLARDYTGSIKKYKIQGAEISIRGQYAVVMKSQQQNEYALSLAQNARRICYAAYYRNHACTRLCIRIIYLITKCPETLLICTVNSVISPKIKVIRTERSDDSSPICN